MIYGRIYNGGKQRLLLGRVMRTTTVFERMRGLLARPPLKRDEALLISPCSSVHTFGMRYPIDLVFLSHGGTIRRIFPRLRPLRLAWSPGAAMALELAAGAAAALELAPGQELEWSEAE